MEEKSSHGIFALFALILLAGFFLFHETAACRVTYKMETVQGNSLSGIIEDGSKVRAELGYYTCHPIVRGDFILYRYASDKSPLLKMVKGVPGDMFGVETSGTVTYILINRKPLTNAAGEVYQLDSGADKILSLYINDYRGVIPSNAYLIMGNLVGGSLDSSRFGLVSGADIIGRAQIIR